MKRFSKATLLSLVFLSSLFGSVLPTFAQQVSPIFPEYTNLFDGSDPAKNLTMQLVSTVDDPSSTYNSPFGTPVIPAPTPYPINPAAPSQTPHQIVSGFKFNFQGSFSPTVGTPNYKKWHWDHIEDFGDTALHPAFILRICSVDTSGNMKDDDSCLFTPVPYATYPDDHDLKVDGTQYCNGTSPCTPPAEDQPTTKIYHWRAASKSYGNVGGVVYGFDKGDTQYAKFNVQFNATSLSHLQSDGTLGTPIAKADVFKVGDPTTYQADMWYCGQNFGNQTLDANGSSPTIHAFNGLCKDADGKSLPYFRIAQSQQFRMPATDLEATTQTTTPVAAVNTSDAPGIPQCSMTGGTFGSGSFMGCIAIGVYYVIYRPVAWFAGLLGELFDFFLGYSLNDASYRADFAVRGWQIVRDISNVFFIIILVWVGLSTVFKTNTNLKRIIPNLILNALIINFSLFATRVVIDISNVVARVFYHSVEVCDGKCVKDSNGVVTNPKAGIAGYTPLSEKIVSAFNPQRIFSAQVLDQATALPDDGSGTQTKTHLDTGSSDYAGYFVIVSLIAALILFAIAMMFWKTAFFFLGRVIGLYIAMIFAPFAFLSRGNIPLVSGIKELSWDNWVRDLTNYALLAPIFVFFLYIIYSLLESDFITVYLSHTGTSFFETVIYVAIPMLIVYFIIKQGVGIAERYAGAIGKQVQGFVDKTVGGVGGIVGTGVGLATGGAALGLRGASTFLNQGAKKSGFTNWAASNAENNFFARQANKTIKWSQTSSMDVRNAGIKIGKKEYTAGGTFAKSLGFLGAKPDYKLPDRVGLSQKAFLGGNMKIRKERSEAKVKTIDNRISYDHIKDKDAAGVWETKKNKSIQEAGEKKWQSKVSTEDLAKQSNVYKDFQNLIDQAQQQADRAKASGNTTAADRYGTLVTQRKGEQSSQLENEKRRIEGLRANDTAAYGKIRDEYIDNLKKNDDYKNSRAYTEATTEEKSRLDKFGDIKDTKKLASAMRSEYARNLRENSFWMKNGQPRWGLSTGAGFITTELGGDLGISLTGLSGLVDAGLGAIVGAHVKELQNSFDEASKTVMDRHSKTVKGSNLGKLEEELNTINTRLKTELQKKYPGRTFNDIDNDANQTEIEEAIVSGIAEKNKKIKELQKKERGGTTLSDTEELELARNEKEVGDLKRLETERASKRNSIEAIRNKNKEDEEKKKKGGDGGGDKPKDDKPKEPGK